jgi:cytochrome c oxidase subunit IV
MTISPDIQCKSCVGDGRPVKVYLKIFKLLVFVNILIYLVQFN